MLKWFIPARYHYKLSLLKQKLLRFDHTYYSQFGEDKILEKIFKDQKKGVYVDVGAHHPTRYSNTARLYKLGWNGINIDPNPESIKLFNKARPKDINLVCGVGAQRGELTYYQFSDPAVNSFIKEEAQRWVEKKWLTYLGEKKVEIRPLAEILAQYLPGQGIDLLSIDTEGMDLQVLESNNWGRWRPRVVIAEASSQNSDLITKFLLSMGYRLYARAGLSLVFHIQ